MVSEVFITFCVHFKYLGSWISFSLRDDYDVGRRIGVANASMGALDKFWIDHHVNMYSKYMIFQAIPCNLLLWGCEIWSLCQYLLDKLNVFLYRSIRRILGIRMGQVREIHIKNSHICTMFYNISCVRNQVEFRQMTYVGEILRRESSRLLISFLAAWCNNPRKRGGQLLTNKDRLVWNLRLIIPGVDDDGSVSTWGFHALDATHWSLLLVTLKHPANTTPDHPPNEQEADLDAYQSTPSTPSPPRPHPPSQPPHSPSRSGRASSGSGGFVGLRPFKSPPRSSSSPAQSPQ